PPHELFSLLLGVGEFVQVGSGGHRYRTPPATTGDLSWSQPHHRHLLVFDGHAGAAPSGALAGGAVPTGLPAMSAVRTFPVLLETFFTDRLIRQRQASPHTLASYRDSFCLLLAYARQKLRK